MALFQRFEIEGVSLSSVGTVHDVATYIWEENAPFNRVADNNDLNRAREVDISLRKWEIDSTWSARSQSVLWLRIAIHRTSGNRVSIKTEYDEPPINFVDQRAIVRLIMWFSSSMEATVLIGDQSFSKEDFENSYGKYADSAFSLE